MLPALVLVLAAVLAAGCGEREFAPDEFVDAANAEGAGLILGESLTSITEDVEVFAVSFEEGDEPAAGGHEHDGGGSLMVTGDSDSAREEFQYNWKTDRAQAGRCVVFILALADGTEHMARFRLR